MSDTVSRRRFLQRGAALIGCSAAAHPFMSSVTLASAPWDARLVVIILRGGMDGMDVVRPVGDAAYAAARPRLVQTPGLPLDGYFELHPTLAPLMPLWQAQQLGFVHAVSTPYRGKRSHFDGQDILEAGTGLDVSGPSTRDGWLNRMLQTVPGLDSETAFTIGRDELKVLSGSAKVLNWSPDAALTVSPQSRLLLERLYHADPLFRDAASEAIELADLAMPDDSTERSMALAKRMSAAKRNSVAQLAGFAAERLYHDTRIAAFSLNGWDTHRRQDTGINRALEHLSDAVLTLKAGLGGVWDKTTVIAMTEFGRTVRENGSGGTDHGTGGAMLFAGGAVRGGRILGQWPGLDEADLFERRDLMPTGDVRDYAAWALRSAFGIDRTILETSVFPGLTMGANPDLLL
ncbi:DUF1501 domain-containing protein [Oceaniglobus ichthyenteri]|uniref:DUF1501 domain-containing protein n=1 Tax=Oceaniglobus ichthyenteri TaxID=2136177 RepID=UPI000D36CFC1|nr:DUF1501 domain-containing protein [Oceaniglobus ichthyenteri]